MDLLPISDLRPVAPDTEVLTTYVDLPRLGLLPVNAWATVDAPWLGVADEQKLSRALDGVRRLGARAILSSHLPPARGMDETLLSHVAAARTAPRFVGPDQQALIAMAQSA